MDIYIGNLHYEITEEQLKQIFEEYGQIDEVKIIKDRETGRSKGFGFVTIADDEQGERALEEMDGAEINGRSVKVNRAKRREDNDRGPRNDFRRPRY